jgi:hypothetical protein
VLILLYEDNGNIPLIEIRSAKRCNARAGIDIARGNSALFRRARADRKIPGELLSRFTDERKNNR